MYYPYAPNSSDYDCFRLCEEFDKDELLALHFTIHHPIACTWKPPALRGFKDENPGVSSDFPAFASYYSIPLVTQRAWDALRPLIDYCCEALPVFHPSGEPHYFIHVMDAIDCLDMSRAVVTYFSDGAIMSVKKYAFKQEMLKDKHIFKVLPPNSGHLVFDDTIREIVEQNHLTGLYFKPLPMVE